ncbi:uncharacterized protein BXZ73DRAFT_42852 [Epithele typhae]|uniref:uncharacterized protein n=1 Tax=Epithele typhae TaxID=378194 RepID=UPI002008D64C|nr:uncharacterized protein BXZ73DRAFT_42852 [Epithele typhae]KAH9940532.1 hypothetical protein BXZ73DRAFT_42852 [Epithele typhae]
MSAAPAPPAPETQSTSKPSATSDATPTHPNTPMANSAAVLPTPELRLNGRRASHASLHAAARGDDDWGSNFWVTLVDPQSQVSFYACPATGDVSWDPPVGNFLLPPSPDGEWWEMFDEASGLPYYYHTKSGETVWERPDDAFVIPLGVLQNTALTRRLSITNRMSVVGEMKAVFKSSGERTPYRRSRSYVDEQESPHHGSPAQARRSQSSTRGTPTRTHQTPPSPTSPSNRNGTQGKRPSRKSTSSADHMQQGSQGPISFDGGHPLTPIPGSPYHSDASVSRSVRDRRHHGSAPTTPQQKDMPKPKKDSPPRKSSTDEPTLHRSRSKSSSYMEYRSAQPQSLSAALEMIAATPSNGSPQDSRPSHSASDMGHSTSRSDAGHVRRSVSSPQPPDSPPKMKINTDPRLLSGVSLGDSLLTPESPLRFKFKLSMDRSVPPTPTRPTPAAPQPRRSISNPVGIRGKEIGNPVLNPGGFIYILQLVDRNGRTPIPITIYDKSPRSPSLNTGKYPVLPHDLASDIQQFAESEFAQHYFSTHRTGFIFKRKIPVAQLMTWQKGPIATPLLNLNRALHKDAVKTFRIIQRVMGDRERGGSITPMASVNASAVSLPQSAASHVLLEEQRWLLGEGLTHGELRDEIYCQVMKQLHGNPNPEGIFRGWQLLCVLLVTFPPSKNFEAYLQSYFQQATSQHEGRIDVMAKYCLRRLAYISKKGPRGKPPGAAEIETASDAAFHPSIFGETLDGVYRLQERNYPDKKVPIILPFLADGILALGGTKSEGIFRVPGDGDLVSDLKLRIDKGYYSLDGVDDPHVLASLLKLWLRELCDPLVPDEMYNECITSAHDPQACVQIVRRLPTMNRRVVLFVVSFMQLFLEDKIQAATKMTSQNLSLVMAPNLLRCNSDSMVVVFTNSQYEQQFVHNLLVHLKCAEIDSEFVPTHGHGALSISSSAPRPSKVGKRPNRPNH